jgi:NAD(P)-dependent dehydrogenase (short-subunit alcohol dehydrogenase family)
MTLENKVAVVVGGSGDLGTTVSLRLAEVKATVVVHYHKEEKKAEDTVEKIKAKGLEAISVRADITSSTDVEKMISNVVSKLGRIDILVNAAGINPTANLVTELDERSWDEIINVNLKGPYLCCKFVAPVMIRQSYGRIVNIASIFARNAPPLRGAYSASKHGLIGLTQTLAKELANYNITVNAICPGPMNTKLAQKAFESSAKEMGMTIEEYYKLRCAKIPIGRLSDPIEVANVIVFLASDIASYVTGTVIDVAGGAIE